jgi:hypothetical protein
VVDALIGNFDRHSGNWGYIIGADDSLRLAPVYDCGSCLYPELSVEKMEEVLASPFELARRLYEFPRAALLVKGKKAGYYDMLSSGYSRDCGNALLRMVPRIDMAAIRALLDEMPMLSDVRRRFYMTMLEMRMDFILRRAYRRVSRGEWDEESLRRIGTDAFNGGHGVMEEFEKAEQEINAQR